MTIKIKIGLFLLFAVAVGLSAQTAADGYVFHRMDGSFLMNALIQPNGDTLIYVQLQEIEVKAPKFFASADDYKRWQKYRYYAPTVIPYAVDAVKMYRQMNATTRDLSDRDRRRYIKTLENQLEDKLKSNLKNLSRTQGFLLIEMVEKELHMSFYDLVKDVKGSFSAFYWNEFGKMYSYHLKDPYERGKDIILDSVLDQYDLMNYMH